jgi:protein arginine kinase activator
MKCDRCDNPATVHLTQVQSGQMQKMHLCASCAEALGVNQGAAFSMADVLLGKGAASPLSTGGPPPCPECGTTLARFRKTGRLGCPACYGAFEKELAPLLRSMHHALRHQGRRPRHREANLTRRQREEALENELADAVAAEDYETAARLRDALKQLQDSGNPS